MGGKWTVTVTNDLIPGDKTYVFADPKFIGKEYVIADVQLYRGGQHVT